MKKYLQSWLPWRWVSFVALFSFSAPFPFYLWSWHGLLICFAFWIIVDLIAGIGRSSTLVFHNSATKTYRYNELLRNYYNLEQNYLDLTEAVEEYLQHSSTDGASARQPMREKLKEMVVKK